MREEDPQLRKVIELLDMILGAVSWGTLGIGLIALIEFVRLILRINPMIL